MPRLTIDNRPIDVPTGTTILQAARQLGIEIPTLCHREGLPPQTSCMVCLVRIEGRPALAPSCAAPAEEGLVVHSDAPDVLEARRAALELLLSDHVGDCEGPCHSACPAHMNIPRMIRQIRAGDLAGAIATVKADIALPAVLGRICPAPCERVCRRHVKDAPLAICLLKRFAADADLAGASPYLPPRKPASGKKVAVVGAGPAGLAAAYHLVLAGHACTVFEARESAGGGLRQGVPEERLPRGVLDAEIATIGRLGAEFRLGVRVGSDVPLEELRKQFDAVVVAVGALGGPEDAIGLPTEEARLQADHTTHETPQAGVFAAGEAMTPHTGPHRMAVRAEASGKAAAAAVDRLLRHGRDAPVSQPDLYGQDARGKHGPVARIAPHRPFSVHIGALLPGEIDAFLVEGSPASRAAPRMDDPAFAGKALPGFSPQAAREEAGRCLHCDCRKADACRLRDWSQALHAQAARYRSPHRRAFVQDRSHPLVIYESGKCIDCGLCIRIAQQWQEPLGLAFVGRGFDVRVAVPLGGSLAEALQQAAQACAQACPTGALAMR